MIVPTDLQSWVDSICLAIVVIGCVMHYATNLNRHSPTCALLGYLGTGAGAFGAALYIWWPTVDPIPYATLMHVGMAFVAVSLIQEKTRARLTLAQSNIAAVWARLRGYLRNRRKVQERFDHTERRRAYEDNG